MDLQQLSDRAEITDVITRYTRAIDTGDWDGLDTVFTSDARIDYTSAGGTKSAFPEMKQWLADVLPGFPRRQHVIGQIDIDLSADTARATAYFLNPMVTATAHGTEGLYACGGYYHHQMVRTADGWRSRELVEETVWTA